MRKCAALLVLLVGTGVLLADEATGKFKKMEKGTLTVDVKGKDVTFKMEKGVKLYDGDSEVKGKERKKFFQDLKEGTEVKVIYDKDGDKITVKEVKFKK
jgi:uncharacterized protein (DUF2141 family)